jgi:hypothetical protein
LRGANRPKVTKSVTSQNTRIVRNGQGGLGPLKHLPTGFRDIATDLQRPREKPALSFRLRRHSPQFVLNQLYPGIVADGVEIFTDGPSVAPDLAERRLHDLAKVGAGFLRFRTLVRQYPVEQDSPGGRVSQLGVGRVKRGLRRSNQQAEGQRRQRRDDRGCQLDRILRVGVQMMCWQYGAERHPVAKTIPPTTKGLMD